MTTERINTIVQRIGFFILIVSLFLLAVIKSINLHLLTEIVLKIITQKYIALYPVGQEAWTEFRRTGYPKVFPVCVNESNGGCVDTDIQIRRLAFPQDEYNTNREMLDGGISLLNGPDNPGTRLWWDVADKQL